VRLWVGAGWVFRRRQTVIHRRVCTYEFFIFSLFVLY
jgi:hypothetical protein